MAELNSSAGGLRGQSRTTTLSPRVDMTPMVDLMFLLITFFMLTTTLAKQSAMKIAMPLGGENIGHLPISAPRTLNLCLGSGNKIQWYMGNDKEPLTTPSEVNFGSSGLRKVLKDQMVLVQKSLKKDLIVLLKPSDKSSYKNMVDALDELEITGVKTYMVVDTSPKDVVRMMAHSLY